MELHENLNPQIWENNELKPEIQKLLKKISLLWLKFISLPKKFVKDIIFTGSNANFNYTKYSDIDIHVVIDKEDVGCEDFFDEYIIDKKNSFKERYNITIHGYEVEMFVQDISETPPKDQGVFSIMKNKWIFQPQHLQINIDDELVLRKTRNVLLLIKNLFKLNSIAKLQEFKTKLRKYRSSGLEKNGEYSVENLVYKKLRNMEVLDKIDHKINSLIHKKYSI